MALDGDQGKKAESLGSELQSAKGWAGGGGGAQLADRNVLEPIPVEEGKAGWNLNTSEQSSWIRPEREIYLWFHRVANWETHEQGTNRVALSHCMPLATGGGDVYQWLLHASCRGQQ